MAPCTLLLTIVQGAVLGVATLAGCYAIPFRITRDYSRSQLLSFGDRYLFLVSLENSLVLTKSIIDLTCDLNDLRGTDDSVLFTK